MLTATKAGAHAPSDASQDRTTIDRLMRDNAKIRALAGEMIAILSRPEPSDLERLATLRWEMASAIMSYLSFEDRVFYSRLEADPRAHISNVATRFRSESWDKFESYSAHARDWTSQRIQADWNGYRKNALHLLDWVLVKAEREEAELFPLMLAGLNGAAAKRPVVLNWARDAFAIKDSVIGG